MNDYCHYCNRMTDQYDRHDLDGVAIVCRECGRMIDFVWYEDVVADEGNGE